VYGVCTPAEAAKHGRLQKLLAIAA